MSDTPPPSVRFMDDFGMDFAVRCVLSGVRYGMAEVGEILATVPLVLDGNADSWRDRWLDLARRLEGVADRAAANGHDYSAWGAYLRASNYAFAGNFYAPATADPSTAPEGWQLHRTCWDRAVSHWPTPAAPIDIPLGTDSLPGYWFAGHAPLAEPRPLVVIVNGIETPMSDVTMTGLADGLARGYRVLCFDGPGQGAALYERGMPLVGDWAPVLDAVVRWGKDHAGVDARAVSLHGINHGGLFALLAAVDRPGLGALVLDPGVLNLGGDVLGGLPDELVPLYRSDPDGFDAAVGASSDPELSFWTAKTLDPLPGFRPSEALRFFEELRFDPSHAADVSAPVYIAAADGAESFAGQGSELARLLESAGVAVTLDRFTAAEGAELDCEILAPQVRNQRVFDWLDGTLS